jgi:hypothetical protein
MVLSLLLEVEMQRADGRKRAPNGTGRDMQHRREMQRAREAERRKDPDYAERMRAYERARRGKDPAHQRALKLFHRYGITPAQKKEMFDFGCAICGTKDKLEIDHDHETGKVRGALCHAHNTAIGLFEDNPLLIVQALSYLGYNFRGENQ